MGVGWSDTSIVIIIDHCPSSRVSLFEFSKFSSMWQRGIDPPYQNPADAVGSVDSSEYWRSAGVGRRAGHPQDDCSDDDSTWPMPRAAEQNVTDDG